MLDDILVLLIFIVLIASFFAFFIIKEKENAKRLQRLELALEDFSQELHYLKKDNVILSEIKDELLLNVDKKIKKMQVLLEKSFASFNTTQIDSRIMPILESLQEVENIIKEFQSDQQNRILSLEQQSKTISKLSPNFDNEEEKVLALFKSGMSIEQIAKDLRIGTGRVEFILKFNKKL